MKITYLTGQKNYLCHWAFIALMLSIKFDAWLSNTELILRKILKPK